MAGAVVAVEVLVEQEVVFPRWVGLHELDTPVDRPPAVRTRKPDTDQPVGKITGDITQRQLLAGSGRIFDAEFMPKEFVVLAAEPE
jgi:hypothetical protein